MSSLMQSQAKFFRTRRSHNQAKKNGQYDDFDLDLDVLPGLLPMSPALEEERLHEYKQLQPLAFSMCDDAQGRRSSRDFFHDDDDDAGFAFAGGEGKKDAADDFFHDDDDPGLAFADGGIMSTSSIRRKKETLYQRRRISLQECRHTSGPLNSAHTRSNSEPRREPLHEKNNVEKYTIKKRQCDEIEPHEYASRRRSCADVREERYEARRWESEEAGKSDLCEHRSEGEQSFGPVLSDLEIVIEDIASPEGSPNFSSGGSIRAGKFSITENGVCPRGYKIPQYNPRDIAIDFSSKPLGRGACGSVRKGIHIPTREPLAIKIIRMEDKAKREQFINDAHVLLTVQSGFIIKLLATYVHLESFAFHTALELMDFGTLADLSKRCQRGVPEKYLSFMCLQILEGIKSLHAHDFLHRDIKLCNILLNSRGFVKISDFGISKKLDSSEKTWTYVGTSLYLSPERLQAEGYGKPADIWGVGLSVYELACGQFPWEECNTILSLFNLSQTLPRLPNSSPELQSFIDRCLQFNADARATAVELAADPYIRYQASVLNVEKEYLPWLGHTMRSEPCN